METFHRSAYRSLYSFFRRVKRKDAPPITHDRKNRVKVAFIHNERKSGTGAQQINTLMARGLREAGVRVRNFYPKFELVDAPRHLKGIANILFFYSLLEKRDDILRHDLIQGTTYTPLPFLAFDTPVVAHFGSTTAGFLARTPLAKELPRETRTIWYRLKKDGVLEGVNAFTRKPLRDIAEMEQYVAAQAQAVIATSRQVERELAACGVEPERIFMVPNAIEDYWFTEPARDPVPSGIVFLGRLGGDAFTLKMKGLDRLLHIYAKFPEVPKTTIAMTSNKRLTAWLKEHVPAHELFVNLRKDFIPGVLAARRGSIVFISSRYEGFSLSLVECMSQGLVPVTYATGIAPEIIRNGINGYIVSTQKEAEERIRELLGNRAKRLKMAEKAAATARQFRRELVIPKLVETYERIRLLPRRLRRKGQNTGPALYVSA